MHFSLLSGSRPKLWLGSRLSCIPVCTCPLSLVLWPCSPREERHLHFGLQSSFFGLRFLAISSVPFQSVYLKLSFSSFFIAFGWHSFNPSWGLASRSHLSDGSFIIALGWCFFNLSWGLASPSPLSDGSSILFMAYFMAASFRDSKQLLLLWFSRRSCRIGRELLSEEQKLRNWTCVDL